MTLMKMRYTEWQNQMMYEKLRASYTNSKISRHNASNRDFTTLDLVFVIYT
jgi:hypothetical protein